YFLIIISLLIISFVGKKTKKLSSEKYLNLRNFGVFTLIYIVLVGLITQILKHLIGRPRPNYMNLEKTLDFNFFSFDASFHSFPSGHSSTIFAVVLILGILIPSLRIFFLLLGFVVAISRVVVGAHYTSDIIAGGLIAIIIYKILFYLIERHYPKMSFQKFEIISASSLLKTNIIFCLVGIFITVGFAFDVFLSGLFYYDSGQFFLQSYDTLSIFFRDILLPFLIVYIFILPIIGNYFSIHQIYFGHKFNFKEIVFIWIAVAVTIIMFVNILLKNMWGRARPNDIMQFGGNDFFTPWYKFSDSCISNCSFVSGDASVGFALVVFYFLTKKNIYIYLSVIFGVSLGIIRIVAGGHFLSDIIFAQIIVTALIFASFIIYKRLFNE
ncbi:phosphatase PAP2 family protein, partial [Pelagibacterales bacterium SAG-MED31]|nr:phosphatase PAP2 family protein [Pelagibacterales bacterium SAG-MED31]